MRTIVMTLILACCCSSIRAGFLNVTFNSTTSSTNVANSTVQFPGNATNSDCCNPLEVTMKVLSNSLPSDWSIVLKTPAGTMPSGVDSTSFILIPSGSGVVGIDFLVGNLEGDGTALMRFENINDSSDFVEFTFTATYENNTPIFNVTFADTFKAGSTNSIVAVVGNIFNSDTVPRNVTMTISQFNVPSGWQVSFCDPNLCYGPGIVTSTFTLDSAENGYVSVYFWTGSDFGSGTVLLRFEEAKDPTKYQEFILSGEANVTSVYDVGSGFLSVNYPNPFKEYTIFRYSLFQQGQLVISDVAGRIIKEYTLPPGFNEELQINTGSLPQGVYFYSLRSNEHIIKAGTMNKIK